ncbi:hypothetical protein ACFLV4_03410 [Chloroflexota bacterium]
METIIVPGKPTSIIVQTRVGNPIPNSQIHEFSSYETNLFPIYERDFPKATFREPPNPIYNCHGLSFASKRTGIDKNYALRTILCDDGYKEVEKEKVLPGDIALYYTEDGDIEHSGIVISEPDKHLKIPQVLSKWGSYKEAIHPANYCPYETRFIRYRRVVK